MITLFTRKNYDIWLEPDVLIHDAFEKSVWQDPDNIAIVDGDVTLTYRNLNKIVDQLSGYLQSQNYDTTSPIAIFLPKSYYYLTACLAVLKLGNAYINIEIGYSDDLIQEILKESEPAAIITICEYSRRLESYPNPIICLDNNSKWQEHNLDHTRVSKATPDSTAFIGFTSGTTGRPKGIMLSHKAMLYAFCKFWEEVHSIRDNDRFGYVTYMAWDALSPLLFNKTGIIIPDKLNSDPRQLINSLYKHKVNHVFFTPSLLNRILNELPLAYLQKKMSELRIIWLGGEVVKQSLVNKAYTVLPKIVLLNNYGPSECFVVSQGRLKASDNSDSLFCNAGRLLEEIRALVLDQNKNAVNVGQLGFLYVSGPCLSKGYLNQSLTKEKFCCINERIYFSTGDIAKLLPDNQLMIYGRDSFISQYGFDYNDLQKCEEAIKNIEGVDDSIIISYKVKENNYSIAAFIVITKNESSTNSFESIVQTINDKVGTLSTVIKVVNVDNIPTNPISQKIDYTKLLKLI